MLRLETGTLQAEAIGLYERAVSAPAVRSAITPSFRRTGSPRSLFYEKPL